MHLTLYLNKVSFTFICAEVIFYFAALEMSDSARQRQIERVLVATLATCALEGAWIERKRDKMR